MTTFGESKVGNKFQTIIPQAVREEAGVHPEDVLVWEVSDDKETLTVHVRKSRKEQLRRLNASAFGPGDEE